MNGYTQEETSSSPREQIGYYAPPRRFVFDVHVPNNTSVMDSESFEPGNQSKNVNLNKFLPKIQEFIPPKDYKGSYEDVCENILAAYTEIRDLILLEAMEEMQEVLKGTKIEGPNDCVKLLRELSGRFCGRVRDNKGKQRVQKAVGKYEKLVQDSELKVRELIRNEQIYRLNFDQLVLKNEESERIILDMKEKLSEDRTLIESLTKEAAKLATLLRKKDEEIHSLRLECQAAQNQLEISSPESPISIERHKGKTLSCTSYNLRMLLNDNRLTPTDSSSKVATVRKSSNRTPTSAKMKIIPKPGTLLDLTAMSSRALKINGLDKIKDVKDTLKSYAGAQSERKKNGSATPGLVPSGRAADSFNFFSSARGSSNAQQISGAHTPDQANVKQALRIKSRKDGLGQDDKSHSPLPMRAKHHEDFGSAFVKTDSFEEYPKNSILIEKTDRKRGEEYERKPSIRMEQGQLAEDKSRRRSGVTRARPLAGDMTVNSQKSMEHKNSLSNQRHTGQSQKISKSKSIVFENKSVKGGKNNNPLVNIMLKKLSEQESNTKKIF